MWVGGGAEKNLGLYHLFPRPPGLGAVAFVLSNAHIFEIKNKFILFVFNQDNYVLFVLASKLLARPARPNRCPRLGGLGRLSAGRPGGAAALEGGAVAHRPGARRSDPGVAGAARMVAGLGAGLGAQSLRGVLSFPYSPLLRIDRRDSPPPAERIEGRGVMKGCSWLDL